MSKVYIGTSGWSYNHWLENFYPKNLSNKKWLEHYSKNLKTVELNASFYHLPTPQVFTNWYKNTPKNFLFSVKASRFITHVKKLNNCKQPLSKFIKSAKNLKEKLGPILFQLPPSLKANEKKLENFLKILPRRYIYAIEPRNEDWQRKEILKILKKYKIALCVADSPKFPLFKEITSNFVYIRMHGGKILYGSNYSKKELAKWANKIKKWLKDDFDIFVYFNNDFSGYAVKNARTLKNLFNN